jgi:UDP-3-O-[3-hydroxymyristoyl] glucosamine N-acyltransferase
MADSRFFKYGGPLTLKDLAQIGSASLANATDAEKIIKDVATLENAQTDAIAFFHNPKYMETFKSTKAGAVIIRPQDLSAAPKNVALLLSDDPYRSFAFIAQAFYPDEVFPYIQEEAESCIHPSSSIDASAKIGKSCRIDAGVVIGSNVTIGDYCNISANAVIEKGVQVGHHCYVGPNASITHCLIGNYVVIHMGARIGRAGFGFVPGPQRAMRVPQLGRVIIEDFAEIGANTTIDRGSLEDTIIGAGSMIDNLVQLGHNVQLGRGCIIVSQAGISGSTKLGDFVQIGGQAGLTGHLNIGKGAKIAAQSGIMRDIQEDAVVCGAPAIPIRDFHRQTLAIWRMAKIKGA